MSLIKQALPKVSREFALELKARFKPYDVRPDFNRDELMQSVGEQRVINFILYHSSNTTLKSNMDLPIDNTIEIKEPIVERVPTLFERFTNRFGL